MKLLDTTFLIDLANGVPETRAYLTEQQLLTTQINMFEFIRGLFIRKISGMKYLQIMELFETIRVLQLDDNGMIRSAEISADLFKRGMPIDDGDCLTAGIALSRGINTVVTRNADHFKRIKGIKVEKY